MVALLNIIAKIKDSFSIHSLIVYDNKFLIWFIIMPIVQFACACVHERRTVLKSFLLRICVLYGDCFLAIESCFQELRNFLNDLSLIFFYGQWHLDSK